MSRIKKKKCPICGFKFVVKKQDKYLVTKNLSISESFTKSADKYDAIDCPFCGCQILLSIRESRITEDRKDDENG